MKNTLTSINIAIYVNTGYAHNYQHFASLRSLRERLFTGLSNVFRMTFKQIHISIMRYLFQIGFAGLLLVSQVLAATPPKQLTQVIDHFMNMEATSLEITQVIDWRFSSKNDSITLKMDIKGGHNFRVDLSDFGLEIFVTESEMVTINHFRQQILYENATPDALLRQLFVGGDLSNARFKGEQAIAGGLRELNFRFAGDFSDWESLTVMLDDSDDLKRMILIDYDGNQYLMSLRYQPHFNDFGVPNIQQDFLHYQIADLRK